MIDWEGEKMIHFEVITKSNYSDVINLSIKKNQYGFVCDNATSLVEASYEEGLYTRAIYNDDILVGFLLFDYDLDISGWSLSRLMIDANYQGKGYGRAAIIEFTKFFKNTFGIHTLFASVGLNNTQTLSLFHSIGFTNVKTIKYTYGGVEYHEQLMQLSI